MRRQLTHWIAAGAAALALAACGGGSSSDAGAPTFGSGSGSGAGTGAGTGTGGSGTVVPVTTYAVAVEVQSAGSATTRISSTETAKVQARVTRDGQPVVGVVVTFSESGPGLLKFAPVSATALTNDSGIASVDVAAATTTSLAATTVVASASLDGAEVAGNTALEIVAGTATDTPPVPAAINFASVTPADKAIVIKGAGGIGRSESATLTFQVVDASNTPVKDAPVTFSVNPANRVTLNIASAVSDAGGYVTTTVQSGATPTSVVVTATATGASGVSGQSDTLVVSNGEITQSGFEIVAAEYNLDGTFTGDETTLTAFLRDASGNPVPDGVAVSFTSDFGSVASSDVGGCTTVNGTCSVKFRVQDPRGNGLATVIATARTGLGDEISADLKINMAASTGDVLARHDATSETAAKALDLGERKTCSAAFEMRLGDAENRAPAAGTTIKVEAATPGLAVSIASGSTVLDARRPLFGLAPFIVNVDATDTSNVLAPRCVASGSSTASTGAFVLLTFTTPGGTPFSQRLTVTYPHN